MKRIKTALLAGLLTCVASNGYARNYQSSSNLPPNSFRGFVSQVILATIDSNYLRETKAGSYKFNEAGVNIAFNPFPHTRTAAQGFLYNFANYVPVLDHTMVEYTFNDYIGVRLRRIRRSQGIYNPIQDIHLTRTSIHLPQGTINARLRDFYTTPTGSIFRTIPLSQARTLGTHLGWNTPANGVHAGAFASLNDSIQGNLIIHVPFRLPISAHNNAQDVWSYKRPIEDIWKAWTFQTERLTKSSYPEGGEMSRADSWYVDAADRFNKWFEAGTCYTETNSDVDDRDNSLKNQKDLPVSPRFDVKDWWGYKLEGRYINGTGLLYDNASKPPSKQKEESWGNNRA